MSDIEKAFEIVKRYTTNNRDLINFGIIIGLLAIAFITSSHQIQVVGINGNNTSYSVSGTNFSINISGEQQLNNFTTFISGNNITLIQDNINHTITISSTGVINSGINGTNLTMTNIVDNGDYTYTWYFSDGTIFTTSNLRGASGSSGSQGIQGIPGIDGINGLNGSDGLNGTNGIQGIQGIPGINGTNGSQGIQGIVGDNGTIGLSGTNGSIGSITGGSSYYFHNINDTSVEFSSLYANVSLPDLFPIQYKYSNSTPNGNTFVQNWTTQSLNTLTIPGGLWEVTIHGSQTGSGGSHIDQIYWKIYRISSTGTIISFIGQTDNSTPILQGYIQDLPTYLVADPVSVDLTDKLLVQLYITQSGSGNLPNVKFEFNDNTNARITIPFTFSEIDPSAMNNISVNYAMWSSTNNNSYETLSNKSFDTGLGSSNDLYPTQAAVKAYVDAATSTINETVFNNSVNGTLMTCGDICHNNHYVNYSVYNAGLITQTTNNSNQETEINTLMNIINGNISLWSSLGRNGTNGTNGIQGIQGINGTNGSQGIPGTNGINGSNGANGISIVSATTNSSGYLNITLSNGSYYLSGNLTGAQGIQGIQGISGSNGTNGSQGISGVNGINGTNGTSGSNGISITSAITNSSGYLNVTLSNGTYYVSGNLTGAQGIQGIQGISGVNGTNGVNGSNGAQGIQGVNGINGSQGIPGVNGTNGAQGNPGTNGVNGTNGTNGQNATFNASLDYPNNTVVGNLANWNNTFNSSYDLIMSIVNGNLANWNATSSYNASYETISNKSTNVALGTSDILYPTQNAVKTYIANQGFLTTDVDNFEPTITGSTNNVFWNGLKQWVSLSYANISNFNVTVQSIINSGGYINSTYNTTYAGTTNTVNGNLAAWNNTYNSSYITSTYNSTYDATTSTVNGNLVNWNNTYNASYITSTYNSSYDTLLTNAPNTTITSQNLINWNATYNASYLTSTYNTSYDNLTPKIYYPSAVNNVSGTVIGGSATVANISYLDSKFVIVNETATTPGVTVNVNFTNVPTFNYVSVYACYCNGSTNHEVDVDMYNFTSSSWVTLDSISATGVANIGGKSGHSYQITSPSDFISANVVRGRVNHLSTGILNHQITINQFILST